MDGVEAQFTAMVDPFWRADVTDRHAPRTRPYEEEEAERAHGVELWSWMWRRPIIDGQSMPGGLGLRVGKFSLPFGKHAPLHMHQYPFADAPVAIASFLGDHGFTDTGRAGHRHRAGALVQRPEALRGQRRRRCPSTPDNKDLAWGGRLANLWDLTEDATVELSGSSCTAPTPVIPARTRRWTFRART